LRILSVFGTRPEAIKMAPVVKGLENDPRFESLVCVTGQHAEMLEQVNALFGISPDVDLKIMKHGQGLTHITTAVLKGLEPVLAQIRPDWVLVHGDTTTSTAAALAAFYAGVPVGHVEAGLRTRNLRSPWPEEANRQITGRLATLHFAPTERARQNLLAEAVADENVIVGRLDGLDGGMGGFHAAAHPPEEVEFPGRVEACPIQLKVPLFQGGIGCWGGEAGLGVWVLGVCRRPAGFFRFDNQVGAAG